VKITRFTGSFGFLSNFWRCPICFEGQTYPSVEHAFQAAKTYDLREREIIKKARTPGEAKRLGRKVHLRPFWEERVRVRIMRELLSIKFQDPVYAKMLKATDNAELIEGNIWGDTYWGVCNGKGENHLGKLLMEIRSRLLEGNQNGESKR